MQTNVGIDDDINITNLSVFPNPNSGDFTIELFSLNKEYITIEIINTLGQIIYKQQKYLDSGNNKVEINIENTMEGIYVIKLNNQTNKFTQKIIINKHD